MPEEQNRVEASKEASNDDEARNEPALATRSWPDTDVKDAPSAEGPKDTGVHATVGDIVQRAEDLGDHAHQAAGKVVARAKDFVDEQIGERTKKTAEQLAHLAKSILSAGEQLGETFAAPYVRKLGSTVEQASTVLKNASVDEAIRHAESYARTNPWLFLGGALAAGLAGGRVLKSVQAAVAQGFDDGDLELDVDDDRDTAKTPAKGRPSARRSSARPRAGAA